MTQLSDRSRSNSLDRNKVNTRSREDADRSREHDDHRRNKRRRSKSLADRSRDRHKRKRSRTRSRSRRGERRHRRRDDRSGSMGSRRRHSCSPRRSKDRRDRRRDEKEERKDKKPETVPAKKKTLKNLTCGAYIPPAKLKMMQAQMTDKNSVEYQKIAWEALKKSIHGLTNKVSGSNVIDICMELFKENIVRGRGLLVKSLIQSQAFATPLTPVFAALAAVVNSKFPQIGKLLLNRLAINFRRGFKRNIKQLCLTSAKFIAHLYNQKIVESILPFEILILLLDQPTNDSVEISIGFLKECGKRLTEDSEKAVLDVFDSLRKILQESAELDRRVAYMIESMFATRKDGYKDHPSVTNDLELVVDDEQFMHTIEMDENLEAEDRINLFQFDENYEENETKYETIKNELLGENANDEEGDDDDDEEDDEEDGDDDKEENDDNKMEVIQDKTETNLMILRKTIYLTIQSSCTMEEAVHKLLKMQIKPGQELELCNMVLDCCAQEHSFKDFYPKVAERLCLVNPSYVTHYEGIFVEQYQKIHHQETSKIINIAQFLAYLFFADVVSWTSLECVKLNENDTTSSSRVFLKYFFNDMCQNMGINKMKERFLDPTFQSYFEELFPLNKPNDTRFSINFFTNIGLGPLTDGMREHLAANQKKKQNLIL